MAKITRKQITFLKDRKSAKIMKEMHNTYSDVFSGSWCFIGIFSLQVEGSAKPYLAPHRGR